MLKSLLFLPCEKIIVSRESTFTVVNILDSVNVEPKQEIGSDTALQFLWEIMNLWHKDEPEDSNKEFEQRIEFLRPDNNVLFTIITKFEADDTNATYRITNKIGAFPVGMPGVVKLNLSIREADDENEWQEIVAYPINVTHINRGINVKNEVETETRTEHEPKSF